MEDLYAFAACNAPLIGGGYVIGPLARVDDGQLDLCLIRASSLTDFLAVLRQVPGGDHVQDARVSYVRAPAIELSFDRRIKINIDGQVLESDRVTYSLAGRARILAPPPSLPASARQERSVKERRVKERHRRAMTRCHQITNPVTNSSAGASPTTT